MHYKNTIIFLITLVLTSCSIFKPVVVEKIKEVHVKDSVAVHDTLIQMKLMKERVRDFSGLLDTLQLSTEYSIFSAHVDTTANRLVGQAENKPSAPAVVKWKERVVVRDSIIVKEVPVEVEKIVEKRVVPFFWKFFSVIGILALALLAFKLYFKK